MTTGVQDPIAPTPDPAPAPAPRRKSAKDASASWSLTDRIGLAIAWILGVLFLVVTAGIVLYLFVQGVRFLRPELLVTHPTSGVTEAERGGFLDPLLGTLIVAVIAMAIAFPVGLGVGVWLSEFGRPSGLARVVESTVEMLAGTPSIIFALFGVLIFQHPSMGFFSQTFNGVVFGRSHIAAGMMLSLVALPLIVANVREGLQAIPGHVREASYAVGKTKITTTRRILLPAARPSVMTGSMLALGRVIGDTAIIVVLLGASMRMVPSESNIPLLNTLQGTGSTLTTFVFQNAPTGDLNSPERAFAAAFVLLLMVLALNIAVDRSVRKGRKQTWGS